LLRNLFRKKRPFDEDDLCRLVDVVADKLAAQIAFAGDASMDAADGNPKKKAIGYVYGFADAAFRGVGDASARTSFTFQVLRRLWPKRAPDYLNFLVASVDDNLVAIGALIGAQHYAESQQGDGDIIPMGLAAFMIRGD
jgi:hypothetical protein